MIQIILLIFEIYNFLNIKQNVEQQICLFKLDLLYEIISLSKIVN